MATVPSGTRFIGISENVSLKERKSAVLNAETQPYTIDDIRGYKVYTALLTQSGGDAPLYITTGTITIGTTYQIDTPTGNTDFTNVGAPNNNNGTYFVATGTTPNNWGGSALLYNEGAPVATVLENTIGNIWFTYTGTGQYLCYSDGLFINRKSTITLGNVTWDGGSGIIKSGFDGGVGIIVTADYNNEAVDNYAILNTPIEIRVYN